MPQLMPLNWTFSSMMMLMILMGASMIYGNMFNKKLMMDINMNKNKLSSLWCW